MTLDEVTQSIAELLDRPVVIFDADLNVIAFSVHEGEVDRGRLATILNRRATPVAVEMIAHSRARASVEPVVLPPVKGLDARVLVPLRHDGRLYGYVSFSTPEPLDGEALAAYTAPLVPASERISAILALRELADRDGAGNRQALLGELFSSSPDARSTAAGQLIADGFIAAADSYTAVVLRPRNLRSGDISHTRLDLEACLRDLVRSSTFQATGGLIDSIGMVVIPGTIDDDVVRRVLRKQTDHEIIAGVGGPRTTLAEAIESRREAQIAADAVHRSHGGDTVTSWLRLGIDRLLLQLPLDALRKSDLPDAVRRILSAQSGIDLAHTLDCYLQCGGEAQATARALHIHRSTLYYRLDRIRETTGLDLSDGVVRRELHTGLRIAELAGFWSPRVD